MLDRRRALSLGAAAAAFPAPAVRAQSTAAQRWAEVEFRPSTLTLAERLEELRFFELAARPFRGQRIFVLSETIGTHVYEARVLARAFAEITGIQVVHDVVTEGEVVERIQLQKRSGRNFYDAYVNDSDFLGTHLRSGGVVPLDAWMTGAGQAETLPSLDLPDFFGLDFTTGPEGRVWQLPDQQFANLYWFRHDWFEDAGLQRRFRDFAGYDLGVPLNWPAYEDIARFFTEEVGERDGRRIWGHMDYGAKDPSIGWRFTDAWLSIAGAGDTGLPNGYPVDEWGIRVDGCRPVGSTMARGGATNAPAAVYALRKYREWLDAYAPPEAKGMTFLEAGPVPASGRIAQQIFWYTAFLPELTRPGPTVAADGTPRWRVAPTPHGAYWREGMKLGYQDCGAWTLLESTPEPRRRMAWLYAQFCVAKTVSLKKALVGLTPVRDSDVRSEAMAEEAARLGGLVEFWTSPVRDLWTPTGTNVPHYPLLAQLWAQVMGEAAAGRGTAEEVMDRLAVDQDELLGRLAQTMEGPCAPALGEPRDPEFWLDRPGAPKPKLADEDGGGRTAAYADLVADWLRGRQLPEPD